MPVMNIIEAVRSALQTQMRADPRVVVLGEDVGKFGGVFRATSGLYDEFGADRVIDTPLAEAGIIGTAIGMALYGLRPVPEIQFGDFIFPAFDQIVNELAKFRYRSGGQYTLPGRDPHAGRRRHPRRRAITRSRPRRCSSTRPASRSSRRATRTTRRASCSRRMRQNDPVLFMEPKRIYRASRGEVPEGDYTIELGKAAVAPRGHAGHGARVERHGVDRRGGRAEGRAAGISVEVDRPAHADAVRHRDDPRESVKKTGRCVIVHEAPRTCGFGAELIASIQERAMEYLEAPILRVTGFDTPFPYTLEHEYMPNADRVLSAIRQTLEW